MHFACLFIKYWANLSGFLLPMCSTHSHSKKKEEEKKHAKKKKVCYFNHLQPLQHFTVHTTPGLIE